VAVPALALVPICTPPTVATLERLPPYVCQVKAKVPDKEQEVSPRFFPMSTTPPLCGNRPLTISRSICASGEGQDPGQGARD
jgi:hypothetical protein